jgi:hypothetical protein
VISQNDQAAIASYERDPDYGDALETIESYVPGQYRETLERTQVKRSEGGDFAFDEECRRIEKIRAKETDWEPVVVRLLNGDLEEKRKIIA